MAFRIRSTVSRPRAHSLSVLRLALLSVALLDELTAGFPVIGLPLLRDRFGLSYQQVGLLFTVGALAAMLLEPIISLLSDRGSKRWWIIGGAFLLALSSALTGNLTQYVLLLLAFMLSNPAGAAAGLAQAALIDSAPQEETRSMTRWTLLSSVGDFLSPLAVAALVAIHFCWTALCWFGAALWLIVAIFLCFQRFPQPASMKGEKSKDATEQNVTVWAGLRDALRDPVLLRWAVLSIIPTMVDEVFLGFEALYLRDVLHTGQEAVALIVAIQMVGAMLGLFALDHVVSRMHIAPHRLLRWLALLTLVGVIAFLATRSTVFAASALFIISLSAAGWYPIAKGQAYARLPGRSGTVRAVVSLGAPFDMLLPGIVGLIAGRFGLLVGLGFLGLAPVLMLLLIPRANK